VEVSDIREKVEWRLLSLSSLLDLERLVMAAVFVVVVVVGGIVDVLNGLASISRLFIYTTSSAVDWPVWQKKGAMRVRYICHCGRINHMPQKLSKNTVQTSNTRSSAY
jgi:hypothetical protein